MRTNDTTRMVFDGRKAGGSWCRNSGLVCVTLSLSRNNIKSRADAQRLAKVATEANDFPPWKPIGMHKLKSTADLCLVVGEVTGG